MRPNICWCSIELQDARPPVLGVPFGESSGEAIHRYGPHHTNLPNELDNCGHPAAWPRQLVDSHHCGGAYRTSAPSGQCPKCRTRSVQDRQKFETADSATGRGLANLGRSMAPKAIRASVKSNEFESVNYMSKNKQIQLRSFASEGETPLGGDRGPHVPCCNCATRMHSLWATAFRCIYTNFMI